MPLFLGKSVWNIRNGDLENLVNRICLIIQNTKNYSRVRSTKLVRFNTLTTCAVNNILEIIMTVELDSKLMTKTLGLTFGYTSHSGKKTKRPQKLALLSDAQKFFPGRCLVWSRYPEAFGLVVALIVLGMLVWRKLHF